MWAVPLVAPGVVSCEAHLPHRAATSHAQGATDVVTEVPFIPFMGWWPALWLLAFVVGRPLYVLMMALALRACGVKKAAVARWAVRYAMQKPPSNLHRLFRQNHCSQLHNRDDLH